MRQQRIVIVGAGPAGIRAAEVLVKAGLRPVVIDESPVCGGQIYRRQPEGFSRSAEKLYGGEWRKATALHAAFAGLIERIDYRPNTSVWNIVDREVFLLGPDGISTAPFDRLLLATGAMDRILPLPGWTLPGVYTAGGAQVALKHQACAIGKRTAFVGTGPLLYLVASQYAEAGAAVVGVFDTSPFANKLRAVPAMARQPGLLLRGLNLRRSLKRMGVRIAEGIVPLRIMGQLHVEGFEWRNANGTPEGIGCDAVGLGYGLKPESQLAELAGAQMRFDGAQRIWGVRDDGQGRVAEGVYAAGDGANIGGADVAEMSGERMAWTALADMGHTPPKARLAGIARKLRTQSIFRGGLSRAFPVPVDQLRDIPGETILCRCESVTFGEARAAIDRFRPIDVNRLKALARPGMGRCQGRVCGLATAELLASRLTLSIESVGRIRGQGPIKPLPFEAAADCAEDSIRTALTALENADA